ncbi:MAG: hypothetical protein M3Y46_09140 [Actinomycetota bacterium]|nr:hypothetical protein [Actinomycetota bacterium]MDQ2698943.1 hypothetical protein [Actinomycetota bacterium]
MRDERRRRVHVTMRKPGAAASGTDSWAPSLEVLADAGLDIDEHLRAIGVVTGWADDDAIDRLRAIDGVTVESERGVQIAPPDAPVQ